MEEWTLSLDNKQDRVLRPSLERITDLSLYDSAYGSRIKALADGARKGEYVSNRELHENKFLIPLKKIKPRQRLNVSLEFGCWVYKVQSASKAKKKVLAVFLLSCIARLPEALSLSQG